MAVTLLAGPKVKIDNTAEDWALYNDHADEPTKLYNKGITRDEVAAALNKGMEEVIAAAVDRKAVNWTLVHKLLDKYSDYGAADTEGSYAVDDILDAVYGKGAGH